jgi:hypothetical protein
MSLKRPKVTAQLFDATMEPDDPYTCALHVERTVIAPLSSLVSDQKHTVCGGTVRLAALATVRVGIGERVLQPM